MRHDNTSATTTVAPNSPGLLTAAEVAERLKVGRSTVYKLIASGTIPATVLGQGRVRPRGYRVTEAAVTAYLAGSAVKAA